MKGFWENTPEQIRPAAPGSLPHDDSVPHWANGFDEPGYLEQLGAAADEDAGRDRAIPKPAVQSIPADTILIGTLPNIAIDKIPPRPWCYGEFLLMRHAAVLGARDGGGKGAIATAMMLALILGEALLGEKIWRPGPVAIISYEDDLDEWHRRIAAACIHHCVDYGIVRSNIFFLTLPNRKIVLAALHDGRTIFPDGEAVVDALRECQAVAFILDPFNHAHELQDGNSNVLIAQVAGEAERIARDSNTAGLVLHHLRKGANGDPDDLMGATSLRATFRSCRILARMDEDTAGQFGIDDPWRYIRIAGSKENYAPPPDKSTWYRLHSIALHNVTELYPDGDNIAAAASWSPPSPFEGLSWRDIVVVLDIISGGFPDGERYAKAKQSQHRWAGQLLVDRGRQPEQAAIIINRWLSDGVLTEDQYDSPVQRRERKGLFVVATKLAEMRIAAAGLETRDYE